MSDLSGRTLFKRIKPLIKVFVIVDSYLPRKLNNFLFVSLRGIGGKVGIVIRYILVKNLAKKCGDNVVIKENVYISNIEKLELGDNISIHPMCYFECSGGLMIGNNVSIAHSSSILTSTHTYSDFNLPIKYNEILKKTVVIHDDVWIGCGVRILCGVHIDTRCIIGANSLVCFIVFAAASVDPCQSLPGKRIGRVRGKRLFIIRFCRLQTACRIMKISPLHQ